MDFELEEGILRLSIKEASTHPFDGVDIRHPVGSTRMATVESYMLSRDYGDNAF